MAQAQYDEAPKAPPAKSRIPTFTTIEEEAEFWDTHSTTEFEDEWEEVTDVQFVPGPPGREISVWLEEDAWQKLAEQARAHRVYDTTLARIWLLERLGILDPAVDNVAATKG